MTNVPTLPALAEALIAARKGRELAYSLWCEVAKTAYVANVGWTPVVAAAAAVYEHAEKVMYAAYAAVVAAEA